MFDMGKKVLVLGTGAQGTTVAKRLDLEPNVDRIFCADCDEAAAKELAGALGKAEGFFCATQIGRASCRERV